ncbi:hypothetical protein CFOL_v3_01325 [Cephalotus follicularis]|uniref:Uncharacterized protein n=1 Tax=Cephalotus follicularis TaxID=3775 RepID=A0A1Q3APY6_CEPFO|nr:hypothetical protein CFOL_v3_01325 [Cephalotus follicularis]
MKNEIIKKKNSNVFCNYYNKYGHISSVCFLMKNLVPKSEIKKIWVPKGTIVTNPQGPKIIWVPKD